MNKEYNIKELLDSIDFNKNKLTKVNDKLMLTNYQIEVLKRFDITPENYSSLSSIICDSEEFYEETLDEELDAILSELQERNYYENTNK